MPRISQFVITTGVVVLAGAAAAWADIGDPAIVFEASNSMGSGSYTVSLDDGAWDGDSWFWMLVRPIEIRNDAGDILLTLNEGSAYFQNDPVVSMGFSAAAGGVDTHFTITSSTVSFPTINNAQARASAAVTLTESNGDTATLSGLYAGGNLFEAHYNGLNVFTDLLTGPYTKGAFGSTSDSDEYPGGGAFAPIGAVSDISAQWDFQLSAHDQASGTSVFVVVPVPGTICLISVGGLAGLRRRR
ncbi:MAG: hypothetical protein IPJ41_10215 [Phycisphaerales bacterium]|nr:hypothetical protein [Phycisphaerales bacterium]